MAKNEFCFNENYRSYRKGRYVSSSELRNTLLAHSDLYRTYAKKTNQEDGMTESSCCMRWTPNTDLIFDSFLEDLLSLGILKKNNKKWSA